MDYDIVIAGGGMAGASLACALSPLGLRVAVVEAVPAGAPGQPSFDDRSIALSLGSRRIFQTMGLWPAMAPAATAITRIHVSDRGHFGSTRLDAAELGVDALGYVVISRELGQVLDQALRSRPGIDLICPATVDTVERLDGGIRLGVRRDGETITLSTQLLVAADGGRSRVRELLGITSRRRDYQQAAVIANVACSRPHRQVAYERFTDSGPLALLPLSRGRCAVVWTVWQEQLEQVMGLDDQVFIAALQHRFGGRLGAFTRVGARSAYPLQLLRVDEPVAPGVAIIGNAAHSLHPIAGQGFNLGLRDGAVLAEEIAAAHRTGQSPGAAAVLGRYRDRQRGDHQRTTGFTDSMVQLFSNDFPPLVLGRGLGLMGMELVPPLRRLLARHAMGLGGRVSRLGRGLSL